MSGCNDLDLVGVGVDEGDSLPPHRGGFGVTNSGAYQARVSLAYDYRSGIIVPWTRDTIQVVIPSTAYDELHLPRNVQLSGQNLVRDVEIHAEAETMPGVWQTVFRFTFPNPIVKCYELDGTAGAPVWSEQAGCHFQATCGPCSPI